MHYFFLAGWTLQLGSAWHLYDLFVVVFSARTKPTAFLLLGWALPILFVAPGAGVWLGDYGDDRVCWIDHSSPATLLFVVPALTSMVVITFVCVWISRKVYGAAKHGGVSPSRDNARSSASVALRAFWTFSASLGLTQIFGAFVTIEGHHVAFDYLFAVGFGLQGPVLLYFHVIKRADLKAAVISWLKREPRLSLSSEVRASYADAAGGGSAPDAGGGDSADFSVNTVWDRSFSSEMSGSGGIPQQPSSGDISISELSPVSTPRYELAAVSGSDSDGSTATATAGEAPTALAAVAAVQPTELDRQAAAEADSSSAIAGISNGFYADGRPSDDGAAAGYAAVDAWKGNPLYKSTKGRPSSPNLLRINSTEKPTKAVD
jgi:hypothetical protein